LYEEYIHLSFVLDLTVGLPVNQQECFIGKIRKLLHGEVMRIGGSFRSGRPPVKRHPDPSSFVWG
jgi:hypothetical protein